MRTPTDSKTPTAARIPIATSTPTAATTLTTKNLPTDTSTATTTSTSTHTHRYQYTHRNEYTHRFALLTMILSLIPYPFPPAITKACSNSNNSNNVCNPHPNSSHVTPIMIPNHRGNGNRMGSRLECGDQRRRHGL